MTVAGLLLAAGSGRRFGGPKALAVLGGRLLVERGVDLLRAGGCRPVVVVLGAAAADVAARAELAGAVPVENPDWPAGLAGSLRVGLAALPPEPAAVVVTLVDQPFLGPDSVRRLLAAHAAGAVDCVATYRDRPGHPVLLDRRSWPSVARSAHGDRGAREHLRRHPERVTRVPCDGTGRPDDVDTPTALRRAAEAPTPAAWSAIVAGPGPSWDTSVRLPPAARAGEIPASSTRCHRRRRLRRGPTGRDNRRSTEETPMALRLADGTSWPETLARAVAATPRGLRPARPATRPRPCATWSRASGGRSAHPRPSAPRSTTPCWSTCPGWTPTAAARGGPGRRRRAPRLGGHPAGRAQGPGRARAVDELTAHRDLLALLLVWEIGKPWRLACADVDRALDGVRWYVERDRPDARRRAGAARRARSATSPPGTTR